MSALYHSHDLPLGTQRRAMSSSSLGEIFSSKLNVCIRTLFILISTTGISLLNAKAQIAPAVYGQIPGSFFSWSIVFGIIPLYSCTMTCAVFCKLSALEL